MQPTIGYIRSLSPVEVYKCLVLTVIAALLAIRTFTQTDVTGQVTVDAWSAIPVTGEVTIQGEVDVNADYISPLPVQIVR